MVAASEIEVVAGQHGRDATIQRLEIDPTARATAEVPAGNCARSTATSPWTRGSLRPSAPTSPPTMRPRHGMARGAAVMTEDQRGKRPRCCALHLPTYSRATSAR